MSKSEKEKKKKLSLRRNIDNNIFALAQVWGTSRSYFIIYYLVTFLNAPLEFLLYTYLIRLIVDSVEGVGWSIDAIFAYIFIVGGTAILIWIVSNYYWNAISPIYSEKINHALRRKLYKKATEVDLACYETPEFYDKYVKAMDETQERVRKVMQTLDNLIWNIITLAMTSFLIFTIDPFLIVFALIPLLLGFVRRKANVLSHDQSTERKPINRKFSYVRRTFYLGEYSKEMRMGSFFPRQLQMLAEVCKDYNSLTRKYGFKLAICDFFKNFGLEAVTVLGATLYSVWRTIGPGQGGMTMGDCLIVLNSISSISYALSTMVQYLAEFNEHALYIEDVRYFLAYEPTIKEDPSAPEAKRGDIEFKNVHFKYEGAERESLKGINFRIADGERVALVGRNGSGKTTLVKLLLRLYDPTEGEVTLNGKSAKDYRLSSWRTLFGSVFQDFKLFSLSVKENVLNRLPRDGDDEAVTEALKASGAWQKIETLEHGIESTMTREFDDEGVNLSIGEQQKVSLARIFAEKTPFVVLDEPSSALDPIAEHKMFENMIKATEGRSVIFISHRLSSAVLADRVYMMEDGEIIEEGTHRELMEQNGKYAEMFRLQAKNYTSGGEDNG
ncbi:MAG: ABC transporter ATP-binding protein [Clostridia bacterium]|nr:ABC transporter ATP-binding protein [Clostridia bacterium]